MVTCLLCFEYIGLQCFEKKKDCPLLKFTKLCGYFHILLQRFTASIYSKAKKEFSLRILKWNTFKNETLKYFIVIKKLFISENKIRMENLGLSPIPLRQLHRKWPFKKTKMSKNELKKKVTTFNVTAVGENVWRWLC